jgi:hypothetical protein
LVTASILSAPVQQETLASVFRSDQLAWKVITGLKLYQAPGFMGRSLSRFQGFNPNVTYFAVVFQPTVFPDSIFLIPRRLADRHGLYFV